jgi:MFS family permease
MTGEWLPCDKQYICANGLSKDEYYPDVNDSQYIDNWQSQTNMLCESTARIGFLGASFFIGVLTASTIVPVGLLSDFYGRRVFFLATLGILLISCVGFLFARSLDELYIYMFLLGMTFPGRLIVATNYA